MKVEAFRPKQDEFQVIGYEKVQGYEKLITQIKQIDPYPDRAGLLLTSHRMSCGEMRLATFPIVTLPLFHLLTDVLANCDTCPHTDGALAI